MHIKQMQSMIAEQLDGYLPRIRGIFIELGIPEKLPAARGLALHSEPFNLAAAEVCIVLRMVLAFRSVD